MSNKNFVVKNGLTVGNYNVVDNNGNLTPTSIIFADGTSMSSTSSIGSAGIPVRVNSIVSAATITPSANTSDEYTVTGLSQTATINAPSGTPRSGQKLILRIKDNGASQSLVWSTSSGGYRIIGVNLPTVTMPGKVSYIGCIYNSDDTYWDVVAVTTQS